MDYYKNIEEKTFEYEGVIKYIFTENKNNKRILLTLDKAKTNKDLFICCLDIFCKGLFYMHEKNGKVILNELSVNDIQDTIDRLSMTGIMTIIELIDFESYISQLNLNSYNSNNLIQDSINSITTAHENIDMSEFHFDMSVGSFIYRIRFKITCI